MKPNKITTVAIGMTLSLGAAVAFSIPTSAYITSCPETGVDSEGYHYKRCLTSSSKEGFQVSMTCVNIFQVGGLVYGNVAKSGGKSRVKCGFGTFPLTGELNYRTVGL
jgi:hypothetical protein